MGSEDDESADTGRTTADAVPAVDIDAPSINSPIVADLDEDDDDGSVGYEESAERDEIIRERINRTQEQMKYHSVLCAHMFSSPPSVSRAIVDNLSEDQLRRYERFRRVGFSRPAMEKLMQRILDHRVNANCVIVATGIAKVFVGELIEGARQVMEEEIRAQLALPLAHNPEAMEDEVIRIMEHRPLEPFHVLESHRRMRHETHTAPHSHLYTRPFPLL